MATLLSCLLSRGGGDRGTITMSRKTVSSQTLLGTCRRKFVLGNVESVFVARPAYPYSISRFFGFAISKNNKYRKLVADMFLIRRLKSLTIGFNHATRRPNMNVNTFVFFFVQLLPSSGHRGFCFSVVGHFRGHRHGRSRLDSPVPGRVLQALSYNLDHLPLTTSR